MVVAISSFSSTSSSHSPSLPPLHLMEYIVVCVLLLLNDTLTMTTLTIGDCLQFRRLKVHFHGEEHGYIQAGILLEK